MSAGFIYQATLRTDRAERTEYVTLPEETMTGDRAAVAVAQWNMVWEAGRAGACPTTTSCPL
jgi:hypothetical protein